MTNWLWQEELGLEEPQGQLALEFDDAADQPSRRKQTEAKRSIHYMLEAALRYGKVGGYVDLLDHVAALAQYKPYNALLVLLQLPAATYVLPAHKWGERFGRVIRPNEQPLVLLQQGGPVMFLFDVSQTEETPGSRPLPKVFENPFAMKDVQGAEKALSWVIENAKSDGVRISDARHGLPAAGCIWPSNQGVPQGALTKGRKYVPVPIRYEALLNRSHSPTERLATIAHELGHLYCGHVGTHDDDLWPDRSRGLAEEQRELEAESVARLVFKRLHPDVQLPHFLEQYFTTVPELPPSDLERVLTAAGRIIDMAQGLAPRRPKLKSRREQDRRIKPT